MFQLRGTENADLEAIPMWPVLGTKEVRAAGIREGEGSIGNKVGEVSRDQLM